MHFEAKANLGSPLQPASMFATTNTIGNSNISVGDFFFVRFSQNTQKICYFSVGIKKYPQKYQKTDRIIELFFCA